MRSAEESSRACQTLGHLRNDLWWWQHEPGRKCVGPWLGHGVMILKGRRPRWFWRNVVARLWQWVCGKATGHVPSPHERGYGGGPFMDYWCEFCDKLLKVPIQEDAIGSRKPGTAGAALDNLIVSYGPEVEGDSGLSAAQPRGKR